MAIAYSSTGDILLHHDLTLVSHNLMISYDAAHYHSIRLNVAIHWIIYAAVGCFGGSGLPIVIVNSNQYWQFWHGIG